MKRIDTFEGIIEQVQLTPHERAATTGFLYLVDTHGRSVDEAVAEIRDAFPNLDPDFYDWLAEC